MGGPGHSAVRGRYLPALDGLRALAVGGVVAYHLRLGAAAGGYLGVDLFFVLSGFLITGLLLEEHVERQRIALGAFWARRARRLLPALLLLLAALAVAVPLGAAAGAVDVRAVRSDALATLAYVANWHQLLAGQSYFAQFQAPSPLQHTWSLGIEEQFYLLWPPLLVLGLALRNRLTPGERRWRGPLLAGTLVAAVASAAWMGWLAAGGASVDRLYYGTDTRAFDLLAGAALAVACVQRPEPSPRARRVLHTAGPIAALGLAALWVVAGSDGQPPRLMFEGGFALAALAAVVVLADARLDEPGPLGRLLRLRGLRAVGRISYGIYLWHWPVVTELTTARTGLGGAALDGARVALTLLLAVASYVLVERPLRRAHLAGWPRLARAALVPVGMAATAVVVAIATVPPAVAQAAAGGPSSPGATAGAGDVAGRLEPLAGGRVPSAARPLRVLLVGDSVMRTEAPALQAALQATGAAVVADDAYPGWGLSTDHAWARRLPLAVARSHADVVVAMWSWDNDWLLADPAGYRRAVEHFLRVLLHPGGGAQGAAGVALVEFPPLGPAAEAPDPAAEARRIAGVSAWNQLASSLPSAFPGHVVYLPVARAVERGGRYTSWMAAAGPGGGAAGAPNAPSTPGASVRVRAVDDTHFCPAGAARYAAALTADLHQLLALPVPGTRWWHGSWAADSVYDTPAGTCPADQPPAGG